MENQQNIIHMGHLYRVMVDIEGACTLADFEVIKIVDDRNPYPSLIGIYWDFDMDVILICSQLMVHGIINGFAIMRRRTIPIRFIRSLCMMRAGSTLQCMDESHGIGIFLATSYSDEDIEHWKN